LRQWQGVKPSSCISFNCWSNSQLQVPLTAAVSAAAAAVVLAAAAAVVSAAAAAVVSAAAVAAVTAAAAAAIQLVLCPVGWLLSKTISATGVFT
jgi:hypothetical protein